MIFSRLALFYVLLVLPLKRAAAVSCGNWATSDCIGETDVRYDPNYTSNMTEIDPVWGLYEGYWTLNVLTYGADGLPVQPTHAPPEDVVTNAWPYTSFPYLAFYNITIDKTTGSRLAQHRYFVNPPASTEFCAEPVPPGLVNVFEPGVCGVNGYSWWGEAFGVTSYEKDGSVSTIGTAGRLTVGGDVFVPTQDYTSYPVDNTTIYSSTSGGQGVLFTETVVFIDDAGTRATSVLDYYAKIQGIGNVLIASNRYAWQKVTSAGAFTSAIQAAYTTYNVPAVQRVQGGELPMVGECLASTCPTEDDWCTADPTCSESPYQEPDASVKAGVIVGFSVLGFLVVVFFLYLWHRRRMAQQAQRYKNTFARRIAETIELTGSTRQLTPGGLAKEFDKIDSSQCKDGFISKEELWEFISSGKAGEMSQKDFDALFSAIDIDNNGKVDFMEFCAFMGQCTDEFEEMKRKPSVLKARPSMRALAADAITARSVPMTAIEEAKKGDDLEEGEGEA